MPGLAGPSKPIHILLVPGKNRTLRAFLRGSGHQPARKGCGRTAPSYRSATRDNGIREFHRRCFPVTKAHLGDSNGCAAPPEIPRDRGTGRDRCRGPGWRVVRWKVGKRRRQCTNNFGACWSSPEHEALCKIPAFPRGRAFALSRGSEGPILVFPGADLSDQWIRSEYAEGIRGAQTVSLVPPR